MHYFLLEQKNLKELDVNVIGGPIKVNKVKLIWLC